MEHSLTSATGTGWERTPWHAGQSAACSLFSIAAEAQATRTSRIGDLGNRERDTSVRATGAMPRRLAGSRTRIRADRGAQVEVRQLGPGNFFTKRNTSLSLNRERRYGLTGTSTNFSPVLTRTRRSTGVERPVGTVPR